MRRLRIAMVSEHASPLAMLGGVDAGGQNIHVAELASALARRGHTVRIYTRRDNPDLAPVVPFGPGVDVEHVPAGPPRPIPKDELLPYMGELGRYLATRKRRFQGDQDTSPPTRQGLERQLGLLADRVIAQCGDEVEELGRMGIPRTNIAVIPSGVNIDRFGSTGPVADRRAGTARILTVGRLVPRKGFADLIGALPAVRGAELVIIGGPPAEKLSRDPEARRLRALAKRAGVADRVRLLGSVRREDMPAWYRSADVLACAPWYEPFGLTPLEAMACGVPVVAYAVGGLAESVIDGVTGVLVRPRDVRQLASALRGVLGNPVLRMSYASAAGDRVRSRYPWDRTAAEMERVYATVTGEPVIAGEALSEVSS